MLDPQKIVLALTTEEQFDSFGYTQARIETKIERLAHTLGHLVATLHNKGLLDDQEVVDSLLGVWGTGFLDEAYDPEDWEET